MPPPGPWEFLLPLGSGRRRAAPPRPPAAAARGATASPPWLRGCEWRCKQAGRAARKEPAREAANRPPRRDEPAQMDRKVGALSELSRSRRSLPLNTLRRAAPRWAECRRGAPRQRCGSGLRAHSLSPSDCSMATKPGFASKVYTHAQTQQLHLAAAIATRTAGRPTSCRLRPAAAKAASGLQLIRL